MMQLSTYLIEVLVIYFIFTDFNGISIINSKWFSLNALDLGINREHYTQIDRSVLLY